MSVKETIEAIDRILNLENKSFFYLIVTKHISGGTTTNLFFYYLADVRIFDNQYCRRVYDTIFDPTTEICAGDYDQRRDTMV
jgi:hypothetical protein